MRGMEGNFDIDAGDGGGDHLGPPKSQKITRQKICTKIVHTSGTLKNVKTYLQHMFIYTENDTESDTRIKNNNLQYKTHQQYTNTFPEIHIFRTFSNCSKIHIFEFLISE